MRHTSIRLGTYETEGILSQVREKGDLRTKVKAEFDGHMVKLSSKRLMVFCLKGTTCVQCGIQGRFFALEKHPNDGAPHFELYAVDDKGEEVLMTKDHIIPKSKGGSDRLDNLQPMCEPCNLSKGNS